MTKTYFRLLLPLFLLVLVACSSENSSDDGVDQPTVADNDTLIKLSHFISGEYYGDVNGNGTNFISMVLSDGLDWNQSDYNFSKAGKYVLLEINSKQRSDMMPEVGLYKPKPSVGDVSSTYDPGVLAGDDGSLYATSTYLSEVDTAGHEVFTPLVTGPVIISKTTDGTYTINMNMKDDFDDPVKIKYEGKLPLIFIGYKYEPQTSTNINLDLTNVTRADYWGDFFHNGTTDMLIDFATADGNMGVNLELFCPSTDVKSITPGTYNLSTDESAMTAKPGYYNGFQTLYPSYTYSKDEYGYQGLWWLEKGTVTIEGGDNDIYTVTIDAYSHFGLHITASYHGNITIKDATVTDESNAKAKMAAKYNRMKINNLAR